MSATRERVGYFVHVIGSDEEECRDEADAQREKRRLEAHGYLVRAFARTITEVDLPAPTRAAPETTEQG